MAAPPQIMAADFQPRAMANSFSLTEGDHQCGMIRAFHQHGGRGEIEVGWLGLVCLPGLIGGSWNWPRVVCFLRRPHLRMGHGRRTRPLVL